MNRTDSLYKRYRFPAETISQAVWPCSRFNLSHCDIEELSAERGITVTCDTIRLWCRRFAPKFARRLQRKHRGCGDTFIIDEVFVKIDGKQHSLWRAVDRAGEVVDVFLQKWPVGKAAKRFFRRLIESHQGELRKVVTDI